MGENKGNPKGNPHLLEGSQYTDKMKDSDFPSLSQVSWKKLLGNEHCRRWKRHDHISRAESGKSVLDVQPFRAALGFLFGRESSASFLIHIIIPVGYKCLSLLEHRLVCSRGL